MRAPPALAEFVRAALARGQGRDAIAAALRAAGWSGREVEAGLAEWAEADGLPPVPRPRAGSSPRDALRHGALFVALGLVCVQLGVVAFALIDRTFPDPLSGGYGFGGGVRWAVAALVVAWPLWAWLTLALARDAEADPGARRAAIGRWLTAAALFVAGVVILGDLIAVLAAFLGGELTPRFLLKAAVVGAIAAATLAIYLPALRADDAP